VRTNVTLLAGCCLALFLLTVQPQAAEEKPTTANEAAKAEKPTLSVAEQHAEQILDWIGVGKGRLDQTLDEMVLLSQGQLRPTDERELKAKFYFAALKDWHFQQALKVSHARNEAALRQQFGAP